MCVRKRFFIIISYVEAGVLRQKSVAEQTVLQSREEGMSELKFSTGSTEAAIGHVPVVAAGLGWRDRLGALRVRWRFGRNRSSIPPGLYALGSSDGSSEVLVTANYKLSFDKLRQALPGRDFWIVALDTEGINVWCAAGKGTFSTEELVKRIGEIHLNEIVDHRRLIVPQLGAPGVAAHQVKKESGFSVVYGPIRSADLPAFIDNGMKATEEMRRVTFPLRERMAVAPVEIVGALKVLALVMPAFFFLSGLFGPFDYWINTSHTGFLAVAALIAALIGGTLLVPLL